MSDRDRQENEKMNLGKLASWAKRCQIKLHKDEFGSRNYET